ncbi:MAG: hypothetical protein Pg6C_08820 [Treponemataceae bacterium]|nr:MAG: hypothetical protein Pg6C_08820 [Treponemataceae bacterium]
MRPPCFFHHKGAQGKKSSRTARKRASRTARTVAASGFVRASLCASRLQASRWRGSRSIFNNIPRAPLCALAVFYRKGEEGAQRQHTSCALVRLRGLLPQRGIPCAPLCAFVVFYRKGEEGAQRDILSAPLCAFVVFYHKGEEGAQR